MPRQIKISRKRRSSITNVEPSSNVFISFTETGELFINTQQGTQLKISDIVTVNSEAELVEITKPIESALYIVRDSNSPDVKFYNASGNVFISIMKELKDKTNEVQSKLEELSERIDSDSASLDEYKKSLTNEFLSVNKKIADISKQITDLINGTNSNFEEVNKAITLANENISSLDGKITTVNEQIETIKNSITTINNNIETANSSIADVEGSIDGINKKISDLGDADTGIINTVNDIKDLLKIKKFNVVINITSNLLPGDMKERIFIEDYILDTDQSIKFDKIKIETYKPVTKAINLSLVYVDDVNGAEIEVVKMNLNDPSSESEEIIEDLNPTKTSGYFFIRFNAVDESIDNTRVVVSLTRAETNPFLTKKK